MPFVSVSVFSNATLLMQKWHQLLCSLSLSLNPLYILTSQFKERIGSKEGRSTIISRSLKMESQVVQSHGHGQEHKPNRVELHSAVEGEDLGEHHQEKKSVLNKVKAKAKKLKDTIAKHSPGHGHDHDNRQEGHVPDDHDLDQEDEEEEDEEMVEHPEVHGAPIYESTAMGAAAPPPTATEMDKNPLLDRSQEHATKSSEENRDCLRANYRETMPVEEGTRAPVNTPQATVPPGMTTQAADPARTLGHETPDQYKVNLTRPTEEDPDAPKDREELYRQSNYQTKVTDPTGLGGYEAKTAPLEESFSAMHIGDQTETKPIQVPGKSMGSHDLFSPEPVTKETESLLGNREPVPESDTAPTTKGGPEDEKPSSSGSYTGKISSASSAVADKAIAMKNVITSKLGYGTSPEGGDVKEMSGDGSPRQGGSARKISSATHAIADKANTDTNLVASKIPKGDQAARESSGVTDHLGDNPSEQSSYTGKIAAVAGSAKDAVASKLGYGKKDDVASRETEQKIVGGSAGETTLAAEQGKKVAGQDKGVSVRDYLADKLKPGEEDRALSEVISSALDKRKKEAEKPVVVTESEEVSQHLGEGSRGQGPLSSSPGRAMVDKLKGAVGSWFGKSGDAHAPQHSHGSEAIPSGADTAQEQEAGERRLQESTG